MLDEMKVLGNIPLADVLERQRVRAMYVKKSPLDKPVSRLQKQEEVVFNSPNGIYYDFMKLYKPCLSETAYIGEVECDPEVLACTSVIVKLGVTPNPHRADACRDVFLAIMETAKTGKVTLKKMIEAIPSDNYYAEKIEEAIYDSLGRQDLKLNKVYGDAVAKSLIDAGYTSIAKVKSALKEMNTTSINKLLKGSVDIVD